MRIYKNCKRKLHTAIYHTLREHPSLDALQYLLRNRKNMEKCERMAGRLGSVFQCDSFGERNKEKNLYLISYGDARNGFFIHFHWLLKYLCVAQRYGFIPVVEWSKDIPYAEGNPVNGTCNPFEYYFEQPGHITPDEARDSYNVFRAETIHLEDHFLNREIPDGEKGGYLISDQMMECLAEAERKYIRLNKQMQEYIEKELSILPQNERIIGVHYRGSDFKKNYNKHPVSIGVEEYICNVEGLLQKGYDRIFLATDDAGAVCAFEERFGDKVIYFKDVVRTDGTVSVAFSEERRENHKYLLGREVLRDMLTLAACDAIVSGMSQVSISAQITKLSYNERYEDRIILSKGVNHNLNYFG